MTEKIAAAILAGGQARRLGGIAKGNILLSENTTIVDRIIVELNKVDVHEIIINANSSDYNQYGKKIISDERCSIGPLAGIEAALKYFHDKYAATLFLPCDLPKISAYAMQRLIKQYQKSNAEVVFAITSSKKWHPLCAVINNFLLNDISEIIDQGMLKICDVWQQFRAELVQFSNESVFININEIRDYKNFLN